MSHRIVGSNFDTMSRETTSHPAARPIDFVPQNSSSSLGMFNNYHQHNKARTGKGAAQAVSHARTNLFLIGDRTGQASMWKLGKVRSNAKGCKFLCMEPLFWQSEASLEPRAFSEPGLRGLTIRLPLIAFPAGVNAEGVMVFVNARSARGRATERQVVEVHPPAAVPRVLQVWLGFVEPGGRLKAALGGGPGGGLCGSEGLAWEPP